MMMMVLQFQRTKYTKRDVGHNKFDTEIIDTCHSKSLAAHSIDFY